VFFHCYLGKNPDDGQSLKTQYLCASQGHSKDADDAQPGHLVKIMTEATVQQVEELIRADGRITTDSVAVALGHSHGLAYNVMLDCLKFQKVCA
jgi:fructose/tagatose bisphosphate aldolase